MSDADLANFLAESAVTRLEVAFLEPGYTPKIYRLGDFSASSLVRPAASLSKPVFVYGVLLLAQRGVLDLDRPLEQYLDEPYEWHVPHLSEMTARQTMAHTTGLPNWRDVFGLRPAFPPGTAFSYSSEGLTYLQYVVEHITGLHLPAYLQQQVLIPLGMQDSYLATEDKTLLNAHLHFLDGPLLANAALSLRTTIEDYGKFMRVMLGAVQDGPLELRWRMAMRKRQVSVGDQRDIFWGLGWGLQRNELGRSFWHWGSRDAGRWVNFALGLPKQGRGIVIFTNHRDGLALARQIIERWSGCARWPAFDWLLPPENWRADGRVEASHED